MGAIRTITRPVFPFVPHTATFINEEGRLAVTQAEREAVAAGLGQAGSGFWNVWSDPSSRPVCINRLLSVIQDMCDFTIVVENHASGRWMSQSSSEVIDQRNYVQHRLMSLISEEEFDSIEPGRLETLEPQYECCRLACIVFSFLVVFPVPPVVGPFETLTERLKLAIQEIQWAMLATTDIWRQKLHVWVLVLGAIASIGLPGRRWFELEVAKTVRILRIHEWKDMKILLKQFLWHSRTSDADGMNIWRALDLQLDAREMIRIE
jgi:hypothetical protein